MKEGQLFTIFTSGREIVFSNQKGDLVWVSVDEDAQIERLIQEREGLGETVIEITSSDRAKKLIKNQHEERSRDRTNDLILKRF